MDASSRGDGDPDEREADQKIDPRDYSSRTAMVERLSGATAWLPTAN